MAAEIFNKTVIIGTGLIGGSIALDLRKSGICRRLVGVERSPDFAEQAVRLGLVDEVQEFADALDEANLVILATPVSTIASMLPKVLDAITDHAVVVDAGSTKREICKAVSAHPRRDRFVAAHPIAGTENSGPSAALDGLFKGKTNIVCEKDRSNPDAIRAALHLFDVLGLKTVFMESEEHDRHVAYVSHLSHVSSFLLGRTVLDIEKDEKNIFALAGSGFASTVRLAKSSPDMWAPIFSQNAEYLSQAIQEYIMHLQRFHYHLVKHDHEALLRTMSEANDIRRVLDGIELKQSAQPTLKNQ